MAAGTPVVASDLGAFSRVLDDGQAGVLFRTGDSADLAATLLRVLDDPQLRRDTVAAGRQTVRRYDWSGVTDQVLAVYEMAVAGHNAPVGEDPSSQRGPRGRRAGKENR
jgi:phosphatidylinositol alpha-mannosyltransferase